MSDDFCSKDPFGQDRGDDTGNKDPFGQNRGDDTGNKDPFGQNRGDDTGNKDPFGQDRGDDTGNKDPFGQNRGDDTGNKDPFGQNPGDGSGSKDSFGKDPVWGSQSMTPDFASFQTKGTNKLLVVIFIVDCSRSMEGDRIMAVNAALSEIKCTLQEMKADNSLDLKIAILTFTSSAKWELNLTDIDEVTLENLRTRAGLTEYGNAFHELNKVLRKEQFMKHTGKIAPPAIMFLTDGGPTDDYDSDLKELLKNGWFVNASRSAVLMGDAIDDGRARAAVSRFVEDPGSDIVGAENSTVIIQKIKLATMHTIAGDPMDKGDGDRSKDADENN